VGQTQDWQLSVDVADPSRLHELLRGGRHLQHEVAAAIPEGVVLDRTDDTLCAYANSRATIDEVRHAIEGVLTGDGVTGSFRLDHWDPRLGGWRQIEPAPDAHERDREAAREREMEHLPAEERGGAIVTRTVAETAGKLVRNFFETTVANDARARGVQLSIVEHPHLLTTQLAFTLTGPATAVDEVIAELQAKAEGITRFESANLTPI
jgi:hypothetical protein